MVYLSNTDYNDEQIQNAIYYFIQTNLSQHRVKQIFNVYNGRFDRRWKEFKVANRIGIKGGYLVFIDTPYKAGLFI